jgi:phage gp29-like protein
VFTYYDWSLRCYMAIGSDGVVPIIPGNGKWLEYAPFGSYRGWIRGALRPVVEPWMLRHFGFRDMARFGEVHGNPTRVGKVPIVGDPKEREDFEAALANLGADAAMIVPQGVDAADGSGYSYELVEAQSKAWEVHPAQIDRCDMAIVLAILMVNLTTEVRGGSYAATNAHMTKEQGGTQFDNRVWRSTLYTQLARPFAYLNFGDANLAPWTWYDVVAQQEFEDRAKRFYSFGQGIEVLRRGGIEFLDAGKLRSWASDRFGLDGLPEFKITEPVKEKPAAAGEAGTPPGSGGGGGSQ